ncbi:MAG: outer membrane beta-barrel protein [Cyclobacteriaceae bacterium]
MMNNFKVLQLCLLLTLSLKIQAQDKPLTFSAYLDTYYGYDFSSPAANQRLYVTQYDRHNEFNINHAWIKARYEQGKIRSELALQLGTYPINNYGAEPDPLYRLIHSAYVGYRLSENSWVDVGVMGGHFGYESALAIDRELLSPALATEYTPYYQTGVQYSWDISGATQFRAVVLNGWQNMAETNSHKSVGLALDHQLSDNFFLSYGNYYGNEKSGPGSKETRFHNNLIASYSVNRFALTGVADLTRQDAVGSVRNVLFLTGIASLELGEKARLAARYEYVSDEDRILINSVSPPLSLHVWSLAMEYRPEANVSFKLEPKLYKSTKDNFGRAGERVSDAFALNAGLAIRLE